jgi:hypothetical protein
MQDIAFYQEAYPELSDQYRAEIETLTSLMRRLQTRRETPPGMTPAPRPSQPRRLSAAVPPLRCRNVWGAVIGTVTAPTWLEEALRPYWGD